MSSLLDIKGVEEYLNEVEIVKLAIIKYVKEHCYYQDQQIHIYNTYKIGMVDPKYLGIMVGYDGVKNEYGVHIKKIITTNYDTLIRFRCDYTGKVITIEDLLESYGNF